MDEDIQNDRTHVGDARAGHLCRDSKGQDVMQTTHACHWKTGGAALNCILCRYVDRGATPGERHHP